MKLAKSLLLGSAAALATVAGAQAADLPVTKAAPVAVEYVRVCSTYGAGFFVVPGTDNCIKLNGRSRFEIIGQERFTSSQDQIGFRARLRFGADLRTPTEYGLLRTFVQIEADSSSGTPYLGGTRGGLGIGSVAADTNAVTGTFTRNVNIAYVRQAYVQFGGLTAGRTISFFSNADLPTRHFGTLRFDDVPDISTLVYTYSFGNGFSVTAGVEDPFVRRVNANPFGTAAFPAGTGPAGVNGFGQDFPNFVGNARVSGTWGSLQLSGAVQQVTDIGTAARAATTDVGVVIDPATGLPVPGIITTPAVAARRAADDEIGFAVSGSGHINLPMIAAGDAAWVNATYTHGAVQYLTGGNLGTLGFAGGNRPGLTGGTAANLPIADGVINLRGNNLELTDAFSVAGGFRHQWTPTFQSNLFGSWAYFDSPNFAERRLAGTPTRVGFPDFTEWRIGSNLIWSPVSGLDIGVEVMYTNVALENGRIAVNEGGTGAQPLRTRFQDDVDNFEGRLRVQRDF